MARNLAIQLLRGTKANIPILAVGELYLATDEVQLYIGTSSGNELVLLSTTAVPTGSSVGVSAPKHKVGDPGPLQPQKIVAYARVTEGTDIFWIPLCQ